MEIRLKRWARCLLPVVTATLVMAACRPWFGGGQTSGWSVYVDNSIEAIDFVVRHTSIDGPVYLLARGGSEGIALAGTGDPDLGAALGILDPVSCRVVSLVSPLPSRHTYVTLQFGGLALAGRYDPSDFGDPLNPRRSLAETDTCSHSDPIATPRPEPSMVVGEWLNGWEMSCATARGGGTFGVRGEFVNGAVNGCEAHRGDIGQPSIEASDVVSIWNPAGDQRRLGVAWEDTACTYGATVSLLPAMAGYRAHVISIGPTCAPLVEPYAVVFYLTDPIDARLVGGEVQRIVE